MVFDEETLAGIVGKLLCNNTGDDVGGTAGHERHHDPNLVAWIILCGDCVREKKRREADQETDNDRQRFTPAASFSGKASTPLLSGQRRTGPAFDQRLT